MSDKSLLPYLNRNIYIDVLKSLAILGVIMIHLVGVIACSPSSSIQNIAVIFDSFARISVPIFFMCSGYLNLSKEIDPKTFFKKRMYRIIIPLFLWSIFYYLWGHNIDFIKDEVTIKNFIIRFLGNDIYGFLWFSYTITGLYLVTPILRILVKNTNKNLLRYFLILWFTIFGIFSSFGNLFKINISFNDIGFGLYCGYYFLGYYLAQNSIKKKYRIISYAAGALSLLTVIFKFNSHNGYFYGYTSLFVIIMSIATFILVKEINWVDIFIKFKVLPKVIFNISTCTYGIYLSHYFFRDIIYNKLNTIFSLWLTTKWFIPITLASIVVILILSLTVTKLYVLIKNSLLEFIKQKQFKINFEASK